MIGFTWDLLTPGQDRLVWAERHSGRGTLKAGHNPRHHLANLLLKFIVD